MPTRVTMNRPQLHALLRSPGGPVVREVEKVTRRATNAVKRFAPVDTGGGRASVRNEVAVEGDRVIGRIYMARHMWYQAKGTGIYGPRGQPIRPRQASVLVFEPGRLIGPLRAGAKHPSPGNRGKVFARSVRGTPPNSFVIEGVRSSVPWPVRYNP